MKGSRTLTADLSLRTKQRGQGRAAAALTPPGWETLLAASPSAKPGSRSRLDFIFVAAPLDALTHLKAGGSAPMPKPRGSCSSGLGQGEGQRCAAAPGAQPEHPCHHVWPQEGGQAAALPCYLFCSFLQRQATPSPIPLVGDSTGGDVLHPQLMLCCTPATPTVTEL